MNFRFRAAAPIDERQHVPSVFIRVPLVGRCACCACRLRAFAKLCSDLEHARSATNPTRIYYITNKLINQLIY